MLMKDHIKSNIFEREMYLVNIEMAAIGPDPLSPAHGAWHMNVSILVHVIIEMKPKLLYLEISWLNCWFLH